MERKKRSKGRGWESCYVKKIYWMFGVEIRAHFLHTDAAILVVYIINDVEICKTIKKKAREDIQKHNLDEIRETIETTKSLKKVRRTHSLGEKRMITLLDKEEDNYDHGTNRRILLRII